MKKIFMFVVVSVITICLVGGLLITRKSRLIYCSNYDDMTISSKEIIVSDEEVIECIDNIINSYSTLERTDKNEVSNGDVVNIDCLIYDNTQLISSVNALDVLIGANKFNKAVEREIIGKELFDEFVIEDAKIQYFIKINAIKAFVIPDMEEIFRKEEFSVSNYDEFFNLIKERLYNQRYLTEKLDIQKQYLLNIIDKSVFILKDKEIKEYYHNIISNYQDMAKAYGYSFEEYISNEYEISVDQFSKKCYDESCLLLKCELLVDYIWNRMDDSEKQKSLSNCGFADISIDNLSSLHKQMCVSDYLFDRYVILQ